MKLLITTSILFVSIACFAQQNAPNADSLAYQHQRVKINAMLTQRSLKFGQYDESLKQHTGIFGLQAKKDIRRSNDILMDIIKTDNAIFEQTKLLLALKDNQLNYRAYQQQTAQTKVKETQDNTLGFMHTINKLRAENDLLKTQLHDYTQGQNMRKWAAVIFVVIIGLILFLMRKPNRN